MTIVLMIDEVDGASNNQVFFDFLAQLREYYLDWDHMLVFHAVILAGVYDIKNLKFWLYYHTKGSVQVANRIFEMLLYNLFLAEEELTNTLYDKAQGIIILKLRHGMSDGQM